MKDRRLDTPHAISEEGITRASSAGQALAASSPDVARMRNAIEEGRYHSTAAFVSGFLNGLTAEARATWESWLFHGLSEEGPICNAYGISGFVARDLAEWRIRRSHEPWRVLEVNTGHWGIRSLVPAQLLAAISRELWRRRLDETSVPALLVWMAAAGDSDRTREEWIHELQQAPVCFETKRPTGAMRALGIIRLFVEHCEELERAIGIQGSTPFENFHSTELPLLGTQLIDSINQREDATLVFAHTAEFLAGRLIFGNRWQGEAANQVATTLLAVVSRALRSQKATTRTYQMLDGQRRRGRRSWLKAMPKPVDRLHSTPPEPAVPRGEGPLCQ